MLTVQSKHTTRIAPDAYSNSSQQTYQAPPTALIEAVEESPVPTNAVPSQDMGDYDGFEIGVEVKTGKPKAGTCDWGDAW
jgi:hypothetical protein